jgi:hypothetical protein
VRLTTNRAGAFGHFDSMRRLRLRLRLSLKWRDAMGIIPVGNHNVRPRMSSSPYQRLYPLASFSLRSATSRGQLKGWGISFGLCTALIPTPSNRKYFVNFTGHRLSSERSFASFAAAATFAPNPSPIGFLGFAAESAPHAHTGKICQLALPGLGPRCGDSLR